MWRGGFYCIKEAFSHAFRLSSCVRLDLSSRLPKPGPMICNNFFELRWRPWAHIYVMWELMASSRWNMHDLKMRWSFDATRHNPWAELRNSLHLSVLTSCPSLLDPSSGPTPSDSGVVDLFAFSLSSFAYLCFSNSSLVQAFLSHHLEVQPFCRLHLVIFIISFLFILPLFSFCRLWVDPIFAFSLIFSILQIIFWWLRCILLFLQSLLRPSCRPFLRRLFHA